MLFVVVVVVQAVYYILYAKVESETNLYHKWIEQMNEWMCEMNLNLMCVLGC